MNKSAKPHNPVFCIYGYFFQCRFAIGAEIQVSEEESTILLEEFESMVEGIDAIGIFVHNASLALPMFIPGFGIAWGAFSAFSTGIGILGFEGCVSSFGKHSSVNHHIHVTVWVDGNRRIFYSNV